jgi:methylglyoxal synthase
MPQSDLTSLLQDGRGAWGFADTPPVSHAGGSTRRVAQPRNDFVTEPSHTHRVTQHMPLEAERAQGRGIALVAHDNKKPELLRWAAFNASALAGHSLYATGTTGTMLQYELGLPVTKLLSGPVGGDQQIGARIAEGEIDLLVFFWDPLEPQPHDPDVKALLRVAAVWNTAVACNVASADLMISSPLLTGDYEPVRPDFGDRPVPQTVSSAIPDHAA